MPTFVHIDPSLHDMGGHEYDSAVSILRAAETIGYKVALATSCRFRNRSAIPGHWPVYPVFPAKSPRQFRLTAGSCMTLDGGKLPDAARPTPPRQPGRLLEDGLAALLTLSRRRWIARFARVCRRLFAELNLRRGDHAFFETIHPLELVGLARFLADSPESQQVDWHLQVHEDPFDGETSGEADPQETESALRCQFDHILRRLPNHALHFYNPSESLAARFSQLGVVRFQYLPHPVDPALRNGRVPHQDRLRVTCAGSVRREKGYRGLGSLIAALRNESAIADKLELAVQLSPRKLRRLGISAAEANGSPSTTVPLTLVPHPLNSEAYRNLIRQTDIGMFLYDPRRYRFRCSAVLQEMLAAGKPVIVPAGCWLADQIAEPVQSHLERLQHAVPPIRLLHGGELSWYVETNEGSTRLGKADHLSFSSSQSISVDFAVPESATELLISFRRRRTDVLEPYVSVQTEQFDGNGNRVNQSNAIVGRRPGNPNTLVLNRLDSRTARARLRLATASARDRLTADELQLRFYHSNATGAFPAGSVGLIAAQHEQIPGLLLDVVRHYDHYRDSAERFSESWANSLTPARTLEILTAGAGRRNDSPRIASADESLGPEVLFSRSSVVSHRV